MSFRNFELPGRSAVYARNGMAATSHPLATQAAVQVLAAGGNAVDAAVTAVTLQCVVEPHMVSIGGDCFALVAEPDGEVYGLNASGRAPTKLTAGLARQTVSGATDFSHIPATSALSITTPGAVRGFGSLLERFGTIGLNQALEPAIKAAEDGFAVTPRVAWDWQRSESKLRQNPAAERHLLPNGGAPAPGDLIRFPALGQTLRAIQKDGANAFYTDWIAQDLVETISDAGGVLDHADLHAAAAEWVDPIWKRYRDHDIIELPPNGQGAIALLILALLEKFDFADLGAVSPERYHLLIEAARAAYTVRDAELSDPDHMRSAPGNLFGDVLVEELVSQIDPVRRNPDFAFELPADSDTVYSVVADGEGRIASVIASLFADFGSGIVGRKSGVVLHNRGSGFCLADGHPNCVAPKKRPLHTLIPGLIRADDKIIGGFGVMGGQYQAAGHAQIISNLLDFSMDPQHALDWPRVFLDENDAVTAEAGVPSGITDQLEKMGHSVVSPPKAIGGGQIILVDHEKQLFVGGSDPRKDGCALGY